MFSTSFRTAVTIPGMFSIALAAAAQLIGPLPTDALTVFSPDDMPAYVQIDGINRFIFTRTTIRSDGIAQDCAVERSSGDPNLDALTCAIILKRAKFQPSKWVDDSPAYAVLRLPVSWTIGGPPSKHELQKAYPADLDISVSQLPFGAKSPITVGLEIAVEETGRVVSCNEGPPIPGKDNEKRFPELVRIACQQMMSKYTAFPAKDASGHAVRSVQNASVGFSTGS